MYNAWITDIIEFFNVLEYYIFIMYKITAYVYTCVYESVYNMIKR